MRIISFITDSEVADISLGPLLMLLLTLGVYRCRRCGRHFTARVEGIRPKVRFTDRVRALVLEPIFEADLQPEQYAYRTGRSAHDALRHVHRLLNTGHREVVDADLSGYFDSIPHPELMKSVARRRSDGAMLRLGKMWLEAPVEEADQRGRRRRTTRKNVRSGAHHRVHR